MTLAILLGLAGLACALAAAGLARSNRLSTGHGVAWFLIGLLLLAGGIGLRLWSASRAAAPLTVAVTGLAIALLLIVGLAHASALTRLDERVKRLAQEVALLRDAVAGNAGAPRRTGDEGTPPGPGPGAD
jgi:hypothetical protein